MRIICVSWLNLSQLNFGGKSSLDLHGPYVFRLIQVRLYRTGCQSRQGVQAVHY